MRFLIWILVCLPALAGDNLLSNGDFAKWNDGAPDGWTVADGASKDVGPESKVLKGEGGLRLEVASEDRAWRIVTQSVAAPTDGMYRLRFEARVEGVTLEEGQYDNAWIGVQVLPAERNPYSIAEEGLKAAWTRGDLVFSATANDQIQARVFLSKTGTLEARGFVLEALGPIDSWDVMVRHVARKYSYLHAKSLDWTALAAKHAEAGRAAKDEAAFLKAAGALLAELGDLHVVLVASDGREIPTFRSKGKLNFDRKAVLLEVPVMEELSPLAWTGKIEGGFAYIGVHGLTMQDAIIAKFLRSIEARLDAPGIVIDLRGNSGGDERQALAIASSFTDEPRVYAKRSFRSGPDPTDFSPPREVTLQPHPWRRYTKPVVCLIGPGCISSGEGFAKMLKAQPHVRLVGQPTCGASGNPKPLLLPNGVTVRISTWVDMLPDGTVTEGKGIQPDVVVEHVGEGDPTLRAAVKELQRAIQK